jgi:hypothetical protein
VCACAGMPRDQLSHFSHSIYKMSTHAYSIPRHKCWNAGTSWNDIYQDNNSRLASKWRSFWYLIALSEQVKMAQLERSKLGQAFDILTSDRGSLPQWYLFNLLTRLDSYLVEGELVPILSDGSESHLKTAGGVVIQQGNMGAWKISNGRAGSLMRSLLSLMVYLCGQRGSNPRTRHL